MAPGTHVSLEGYARHLDRLLLVAPALGLPFANARSAQGTGRALGANVWFERTSAGVSVLAGYSLNLTDRTANGVRYQPTFGTTHSIAASVAYRPQANTELHVAFWGLVGRSARVSSGDIEWPASGLLNEFTDLGGTPVAISGAAGLARLPPYARADVGARHVWTFSALGTQRRVTVLAGVENLFSRTNVLGVAAPQDGGPRRLLPMSPRALKIGLEWVF